MTISIYAALLAFLFIALSIRTISLRRRFGIGIGDGGNDAMTRAMRVHSNFAEYVPLALVLALLVELSGAHWLLVHFVGGTILIGRCIHAYGVSNAKEKLVFRVTGMSLTFTSICTSALALLILALFTS